MKMNFGLGERNFRKILICIFLCLLFSAASFVRGYYFIGPSLINVFLAVFPYLVFIFYFLISGERKIDKRSIFGLIFYFLIDFGMIQFGLTYLELRSRNFGLILEVINISLPLFFFQIFLIGRNIFRLFYKKLIVNENDVTDKKFFYFTFCFALFVIDLMPTGILLEDPMTGITLLPYVFLFFYPLLWKKTIGYEMSSGVFFYALIDISVRFFISYRTVAATRYDSFFDYILCLIVLLCFPVFLMGKVIFLKTFKKK